jgi:acetyl/propionyl-CoA carboxylase alpha subunit
MRVVAPGADGAALWSACTSEALAAFGDGSVYAERYIANARHIEVQVLGDGRGAVTHLWERDCSTQRRHQKLIEIAPAPHLDAETRDALLDAALRMARHASYRGLGTFEFLLDADHGDWFFIEANARLQVEHTVTEEVLGLDLVALQLQVANGASLAELGMDEAPAAPRGYAVQIRINAEALGDDGARRAAASAASNPPPAPASVSIVQRAEVMRQAPHSIRCWPN